MFHEKCFKTFLHSATVENVSCPECRDCEKDPKLCVLVSKEQTPAFTYEDDVVRYSSKSPGNPVSRASSAFPFWQMEDTHGFDTLCYHGNTTLQDGRQGLLVDPGAWSNLAGETWIQRMAKKALAAGHDVAQGKFPKPMRVAGVGRGTDRAEWEVHVPIALIDADNHGTLHEFRSPVIGGAGRELLALLGL